MKHRTDFAHSVDCLDEHGDIVEHLAGIEDFELALATYQAAVKRWPNEDHIAQSRTCGER